MRRMSRSRGGYRPEPSEHSPRPLGTRKLYHALIAWMGEACPWCLDELVNRAEKDAGGVADPQKRPANDDNAAPRGAATAGGRASRLQPFRTARSTQDDVQSIFNPDALFKANENNNSSASITSTSYSRRADTERCRNTNRHKRLHTQANTRSTHQKHRTQTA